MLLGGALEPARAPAAARRGVGSGAPALLRPAPAPRAQAARAAALRRAVFTCAVSRAQAACAAAAAAGTQRLADLELSTLLSIDGLFMPAVPEDTQGTVFAIYDDAKKLQYIGFSKDLRNTLRTVFGRRPDKAFFYKAAHFAELDRQAMMDTRTAWFEEAGGQPNGNRLKIERVQWELPISSGAISERGKQQAAEKEVERLRGVFRSRGCQEQMVPDPELLADGKVDFLPAEALSQAELAAQEAARAARRSALRYVVAQVDGAQTNFEILVERTIKTNGGHMFDIKVVHEERETSHRVIVGQEYYADTGLAPEQVLDRAFAFLLGKKVQRQTEGLLMNGEFPINYFSMSTIEQYYDDFAAAFADTGKQLREEDKFWRFNRIHTYGSRADAPAGQLPAPARA